MNLKKIEGIDNIRAVIDELEKRNSGSFCVVELLRCMLQFGHVGWDILVCREADDTGTDDSSNQDASCSIQWVICSEYSPPISKFVVYCTKVSEKMLSELKRKVKWTEPYIFPFVSHELSPVLQKVCEGARVVQNPSSTITNNPCYTYVLRTLDKLSQTPIGDKVRNNLEEFEIRRIGKEYTSVVNSRWKHATKQSHLLIADELQTGYGYGAFVDGRLVSWIILRKFGSMGVLQTLPEYRGRGYASLVVSALSRDLHALEMTPYVNVERGNDAAVKLFEKLGFEKTSNVHFIVHMPDI